MYFNLIFNCCYLKDWGSVWFFKPFMKSCVIQMQLLSLYDLSLLLHILCGLFTLLTASDTCEWLSSPSKSVLTFRNVCPWALCTNIAYPSIITNCILVDVVKVTGTKKAYMYQLSDYV